MNILIVIRSKIPVFAYGGTQRVMWYLGQELNNQGHKVSFLAEKGSVCPFAKIHAIRTDMPISQQIPDNIDIIHFNDFTPKGVIHKPYIVTYHGNRIDAPIDRNAVFVSRNHAKRFNSKSFVYNGLDWNDYAAFNEKATRTYYHFLGKAAWRIKNVRGCIDIIQAMPNERLYVIGGYRLNFKMGFRFTLTPKAHFKGMVGGKEKLHYLSHSKGLIFPVLWDEPFGLAVIESLYCGAPIFATPYGSLPELINSEVGFLTNKKQEMVHHLINDYHYSSKVCHEYAADIFNAKVMANEYIKKYETVLSGQYLNNVEPKPINPYSKYTFD